MKLWHFNLLILLLSAIVSFLLLMKRELKVIPIVTFGMLCRSGNGDIVNSKSSEKQEED